MRSGGLVVAIVALVAPGVLMAPVWRLGGLGAGEDDILYYFPSRVLLAETFRAGQLPWLNPWTGLDRPLLADPQSAVFYPFTWLLAILPVQFAYPLTLWLHYSLALWGAYRLLRTEGLATPFALFGAFVFAFCGFMLAHRAHYALVHASAWAPWVFWRLSRYAQAGGVTRLAAAALVATLQCLAGHVQMAAITALGSLVWLMAARGLDLSAAARWLMCWVCAAGLFAVQWLPTLAYLSICTRTERGYWDFVENSWNPVSVVGWLFPMFLGQRTPNFFPQPYWGPSHQVEQFCYVGIVPLLLAAIAIRSRWRATPARRGWVILLAFGLLMALGTYGPICPLLYWLPGASLFRVPARAMLLCSLAVAALSGGVLRELAAPPTSRRARLRSEGLSWTRWPLRTALLSGVGLVVLTLLVIPFADARTAAAAWNAVRPWSAALWLPVVMFAASLAALRLVLRNWDRPGLVVLLPLLTLLDLGVIGWMIDVPRGKRSGAELFASREREAWLSVVQDEPARLWVITPRHSLHDLPGEYVDPIDKGVANTNILVHVKSLTDYGPLHPRMFTRSFDFKPWGELPDAAERLLEEDWRRPFNVGWLLLCDESLPIPPGCELVLRTPRGWRLCRNPDAGGEAFFEDATQPGAVRCAQRSPHRFRTTVTPWPPVLPAPRNEAGLPVRLVVSRLALPGWSARVNGQPVRIEPANGSLLSVRVPLDRTVEIEWSYEPPGLRIGAAISILSAAAWAIILLSERSRSR
jgi:hypothetical protein